MSYWCALILSYSTVHTLQKMISRANHKPQAQLSQLVINSRHEDTKFLRRENEQNTNNKVTVF